MKFTTIVAVLASAFMVSAAALPIDAKNTVDVEAITQPVESSVKAYIIVLKQTVAALEIEKAELEILKVGGTVERRYTSVLKGFSAWLSTRAYKSLSANPLVAYIEEDRQVVTIN
ncbi:hypothetical protein BGZ65_005049 [Modicella reniformis]|uniref:Inhibitor I9 domain-containing protein n=1 Tax=Modicella reniformis TaxID=1440133 RepID=A0A9P6M8Q6_9FUNG|nr:hypothetical protein BGZ65_005049 [Modicella reniformis]